MNTIEIICDGGCRNNQDPVKREAYGSFIITTSPSLVPSPPVIHKRYYGNATNNEAEYNALIDALRFVLSGYSGQVINKLTIKTDSQLLIGHLSQNWKVSMPLWEKVRLAKDTIETISAKEVVFEKVHESSMKQIIGH